MHLTITPSAEQFMRRMLRFGGPPGSGFRLVVSPGGCSGLAAEFSVEATPRDADAVLDHNGLKLFLPAESRLLLSGVTIDFADTPTATGLVLRDPKAAACGCSSSANEGPVAASVELSSIGLRR